MENETMMPLDHLRSQIDTIDEQLLTLLKQRSQVIDQISDLKGELGMPLHCPERERQIINGICSRNPTLYHQLDLVCIFRAVFNASLNLQLLKNTKQAG